MRFMDSRRMSAFSNISSRLAVLVLRPRPTSFTSQAAALQHCRASPPSTNNVRTKMDLGFEPGPATKQEIASTIANARPPQGHKYWGLTIFRCTYGDDVAWQLLLDYTESKVHKTLERYDAEDLKQSLRLTVHSDPLMLESASKDLVRERFREWRASERAKQETAGLDWQPEGIAPKDRTPRYEYCLQVDQQSLESIIDPGRREVREKADIEGYLNLVDADWGISDNAKRAAELYIENPEEDDPLDEGEEAINGCKLHDVGWMKVAVSGLMPGGYAKLRMGSWEENYTRPPAIGEF